MHLVRVQFDFGVGGWGLGVGGWGWGGSLGLLRSHKPPPVSLHFLQDYTHFSMDFTQIFNSFKYFCVDIVVK